MKREEFYSDFLKHYNQGLSTTEICKILGISRRTGTKIIQDFGLKSNGIKLIKHSEHDLKLIRTLYLNGETIQSIHNKHPHLSEGWINYHLHKQGITRKNGRVSFTNQHYFDKIDSTDKAYFLGLLSADGYGYIKNSKSMLNLQLNNEDGYIIDQWLKCVEAGLTIKEYFKDGAYYIKGNLVAKPKHIKYGSVHGKHLVKSFWKYQSSKHTPIEQRTLKFIPENMKKWFILGFYDGDGIACFTPHTAYIGFIGGEQMLNEINQYLIKSIQGLQGVKCHYNRFNKLYYLCYRSIKSIKLLYEYFYNNDNIFYLKRKQEKMYDCLKFHHIY